MILGTYLIASELSKEEKIVENKIQLLLSGMSACTLGTIRGIKNIDKDRNVSSRATF